MHELSLATSIVKELSQLATQKKVSRVTEVRLLIGEISGVHTGPIEFCFPLVAKDTPIEGAELIIEKAPLEIICGNCHKKSYPKIEMIFCQECDSLDVEISSGKEIRILNMEVEYV